MSYHRADTQGHQVQVYSGGCSSTGLSEVQVVVMHDACIHECVFVSVCACAHVCMSVCVCVLALLSAHKVIFTFAYVYIRRVFVWNV